MAITIDDFKKAFAGRESGDNLKAHDRSFAQALKRLDQSIDAAAGGNGATDGFRSARDKLVERYRDARESGRSARETASQLDDVLRQAEAVIGRVEAVARDAGERSRAAAAPAGNNAGAGTTDEAPVGVVESQAVEGSPLQPAGEPAGGTDQPPSGGSDGPGDEPETPPAAGGDAPPEDGAQQVTLEFHVQGGKYLEGGGPVQVVANATVSINNQTETTDNGGFSRFELEPGTYQYRVTADGYAELTGNVDVSAAADVEKHGVVLDPSDAPRADVFVLVQDARTRQPIEGALVRVDNDLEPTDSNGLARFPGVAIGVDPYSYRVQKPGYEGVTDSFFHSEEQDTQLTIELQPAEEPSDGPDQPPAGGGDVVPGEEPESPPSDQPPTGGGEVVPGEEPESPPGTGGDGGGSASQFTSQLLKRGARGPAVSFLQDQLNDEGAGLDVDEIFGPKTQAAVKKFQQDQGLKVDGIVGPNTWAALMDSGADGINIDSDVLQARDLHRQFEQASDAAAKGRLARQLLPIAERVERRLAGAPKDPNGLPKLTGDIQWAAGASGTLAEIPPFEAREQWTAASAAAPEYRPPRDRTVRTRLPVTSDFGSFRDAVVAWIGRFMARSRVAELVDASNLRQVHQALSGNSGAAGASDVQIEAHLDAGPARYESVRFSAPGVSAPARGGGGATGGGTAEENYAQERQIFDDRFARARGHQPLTDEMNGYIEQIEYNLQNTVEPRAAQGDFDGALDDLATLDSELQALEELIRQSDPSSAGGMSVDPTLEEGDGGVCVDPTLEGGGMSVDPTTDEPAGPVCGGDDTGDDRDNPVVVGAPGGSAPTVFDDSNVTFNASGQLLVGGRAVSESNFPGGQTGTVAMDAGQSGQVRIDVTIDAFQDNWAINETSHQKFSVTWDVVADEQGNLTITSPATDVEAQSSGTWMRLDSVNPSSDGTTHVQVEPKVVGPSESGGISVGVGVGAQASGSFIKKPFRLNINVCNIPEPEPEPTRTPRTHRVFFEHPRQADVSSAEESKLIAWYNSLSAAARASVEAGEGRVDVTGYASTTGGDQMNRELSTTRASNVVAILRSYASSRLNANSRGRGESQAATADNVEDDAERRVEVTIME